MQNQPQTWNWTNTGKQKEIHGWQQWQLPWSRHRRQFQDTLSARAQWRVTNLQQQVKHAKQKQNNTIVFANHDIQTRGKRQEIHKQMETLSFNRHQETSRDVHVDWHLNRDKKAKSKRKCKINHVEHESGQTAENKKKSTEQLPWSRHRRLNFQDTLRVRTRKREKPKAINRVCQPGHPNTLLR